MTRDCHDLEGLIDLYAAGELLPEEQALARAHLRGCPACRRQLDEARSMLGLLDVHHQASGGLARLRRAVRREGGRRLLRFAERLAPLAALLLVAVGLILLVPARTLRPALAALPAELAVAEPPPVPGAVEAKGRPGNGRGKAVVQAKDREAAKGPKKGLSIGLRLTLDNPTDRPLVVELGGAGFALRLDLHGPAVDRTLAPPGGWRPFPQRRQVVVPARGRHVVELERLASQVGENTIHLHPSQKGQYRLTATLTAPTWPAGEPGRRQVRTWRAGPVVIDY